LEACRLASYDFAMLHKSKERLARVALALESAGIGALVLTPGASMFYLSGFEHGHAGERLLALVVRRDGSVSWIVPAMNVPQVEAQAREGQAIVSWKDGEGFLPALREAIGAAREVAFDDEARAAFLMDLNELAPGVRVRKASSVMRALRAHKDADEMARLRLAGKVVDDTIPLAVSLCRAGQRESDVQADLRRALLAKAPAGSSVAFTIVASGPNAALPHHETGQRLLLKGDVVILDFGIRESGGYHSDITVTCCVGEPADSEARKVYRTVWQAQRAAIETVRPGVACEEIDRAARSVIEAAGYGACFLHRTGHGLGLAVHEPPYMVAGNKELLEEGMVFSLEPGIYLAGRFGVRLEIIASVGRDGASLINAASAAEMPIARE
jgi:Xaa-Pro aminopeptidase